MEKDEGGTGMEWKHGGSWGNSTLVSMHVLYWFCIECTIVAFVSVLYTVYVIESRCSECYIAFESDIGLGDASVEFKAYLSSF
jgi:hypothetical protein